VAEHRDGSEQELRPWGGFTVLADTAGHKVKRLTVLPGHRLSYQRHEHRAEHWFLVAGEARVTIDGDERLVAAGDAVDIPVGAAHRIAAVGDDPVVLVEVQHGESFGEDDITRLDDDYGRAPA
jgi:mannose-6-phosphate isomerase